MSHMGSHHLLQIKEAGFQSHPMLTYEGDRAKQWLFILACTSLGGKNFVLILRGKGIKEEFLFSQEKKIMCSNEASLKQKQRKA